MTAPDDDTLTFGVVDTHERRFRRELMGLLLLLLGVVALVWLLAITDWRLLAGAGAVCAIAGGLWLGRDGRD